MSLYKEYSDLEVWQESRKLVKHTYDITKDFPKEEMYNLVSQMRRSSVSISSNIAEGNGRQHKKEIIHFLHIARGSLYELETQYYLAYDLSFIDENELKNMLSKVKVCKKLINGFIRYFETLK